MDDNSDTIVVRVRAVLEEIRRAAARAGRSPDSIRLMAATKTVSVERVREAVDAGVRHLGENRLQEALPKIEALGRPGVCWHFIGTLQRRKVKSVVGRFDTIQSVDSLELAEEINRRAGDAGLRQRVLLEVNLGGEASKGGFDPVALIASLSLERPGAFGDSRVDGHSASYRDGRRGPTVFSPAAGVIAVIDSARLAEH